MMAKAGIDELTKADWYSQRAAELPDLQGDIVTRAIAKEMAFHGGEGDGPPCFAAPELPFLQVCPLHLEMQTHPMVKLLAYQNDDTRGIYLTSG